MPAPTEVSNRFKPARVLWNKGNFSVAWGKWDDRVDRIAMRWDGDEGELGFPQSFGHPVWFLLPEEFILPILGMLVPMTDAEHLEALTAAIQFSLRDR